VLQRSGASDYDVIARQLLLEDARVASLMATAAATGGLGTQTLRELDATELSIQPLQVPSVVLGGMAFGCGMAILGYCPGTSLAAVGEGRRDALWGVVGMMAGALLFIRVYPSIKPAVEKPDLGKMTLASRSGTSPWPWLAGLAGVVALSAGLRSRRPA